MNPSGEAHRRTRSARWLLLLPLPILLAACWRYGLIARISMDYRWLLAGIAGWHALAALATVVASRRGWPHVGWIVGLAALPGIAGLVVYAGPMAMASATLLVLVALGLGSMVRSDDAGGTSASTSIVVGLAFCAAVIGWTLPFPVHYRVAYLALALLVVWLRRGSIGDRVRSAAVAARALASSNPRSAILVIACTTVASLGLWLPSLNYDDNAVHLVLQSQLLADGQYRLDVQTQAWAVAPWANNVLHAAAAMLAGGEARPAMGLLWLLVGVAGAYRLARAAGGSNGMALAAAAVFASQPLTGYFTTTMQVDGASTAILMHLAAIAAGRRREAAGAVLVGALCGLLLGMKTSNAIFMLPLLAWSCAMQVPSLRWRWLLAATAVIVVVAGSSYSYAVLITGNPVFPFYNEVFRSDLYPLEVFRDRRWLAGVSWRSLWDLSFDTGKFGEFYPGAAGIALLALLPALLVDALRRSTARWLFAWAFVVGLVVFHHMQYLRYVYPAFSVLSVIGVVSLGRFIGRTTFAATMIALSAVGAILMPTTCWFLMQDHWTRLLREGPGARREIVRQVIPERALLERIVDDHPGACVLMSDPNAPFVGAGRGRAISVHRRYDPQLWRARKQAEGDASGGKWRELLATVGASQVILDPGHSPVLASALPMAGYSLVDREASLQAWAHDGQASCGLNRARSEWRRQ